VTIVKEPKEEEEKMTGESANDVNNEFVKGNDRMV
jgi:hypothetical protein